GKEYRRAFSLSSSPVTDSDLRVTIKRVPGGVVSNYLRDHVQAGEEIEVMPPMGNFGFVPRPENSQHYVLIGGGSGITPLMSIIKTVLAVEPQSKLTLWYCNRDEASIIFCRQLEALAARYPERLVVYHTLTRPGADWQGPRGRLDQERIYQLILELFMEDTYPKQYYLCGPEGLMQAARAAFEQHAIHPSFVHQEHYSAPLPTDEELAAAEAAAAASTAISDGEHTYELTTRKVRLCLEGATHTLEVSPEKSILDVAIDAKLDPPYACQSGICTTCRAMLLQGVVSMDETEGLSEEEIQQGYVLTCQAHPLTEDVELEYR
ncbi:MAG: ferredoxin--NADP reductase, partial [Bacteroidetes bacterium]